MTLSIAIYIEGGGDTPQTLAPFRKGMSAFLNPIVNELRKKRIKWRVIACGGRKAAYDAFVDALENEPEVHNVLLIDSEDPVAIAVSPWVHLRNRQGDGWAQPAGANDARCQMMVVCMEAWFLADPVNMKKHFGGNFDVAKLPAANLAETRTKASINNALSQATRKTPAKEYKKIRDGAKLLSEVDPATVRIHCKWCDRLFKSLGEVIGVVL